SDEDSDGGPDSPPDPDHPSSAQAESEDDIQIQLLKSLPREALSRALNSIFHNGSTSANDHAAVSTPASASSRKRPARKLGQTASNAGHLIPEPIRRKFIDGWKTHVPLQFLTDKYCAHANQASAKELNDFLTVDGSSNSIVSVAKELPIDGELSLSFDEWFQAWGRLLELILAHIPEEHSLWILHFESILHRPNRSQNWALCLEYDSQIRRRALTSDIDPAVFHLDIWNDLESVHIAKRTIAAVRRELNSNNTGRAGRNTDADRDHSASGNRFQPYDNAKQSSNNSFRPSGKFRCFVCGSDDPTHKSRSCNADQTVSGKPVVISAQKPNGPRRDCNGNTYCFSFNGHSGCTRGADCHQDKHWCSLCGAKNSLHSAQNCVAL
ncbi:hypothetical protein B0H14DRAFT_2507774, partial [Mycena olivaceomarginata]